jgi:hypothetical protein
MPTTLADYKEPACSMVTPNNGVLAKYVYQRISSGSQSTLQAHKISLLSQSCLMLPIIHSIIADSKDMQQNGFL